MFERKRISLNQFISKIIQFEVPVEYGHKSMGLYLKKEKMTEI